MIKPSKLDDYRLVLKRGQPFQIFEVDLLRSILEEINKISSLDVEDESYLTVLQENAIERSICQSICDPETASCMFAILNEIERWAARTYEGNKVAIGIIINTAADLSNVEVSLKFDEVMSNDFFALLSDGKHSYIEFDKKGNLLGYVETSKVKKEIN